MTRDKLFFLKNAFYCKYRCCSTRSYSSGPFNSFFLSNNKNMTQQQLDSLRARQNALRKTTRRKPVPQAVSLQVIGHGGRGVPGSVMISTDRTSYLFNCGEGTQRIAKEHHLKLGNLEHVFITNPVWKNMGGLLGMSLVLQSRSKVRLFLHGPDGTLDLFRATENFVVVDALKVISADTTQNFVDHAMTVTHIPLIKPKTVNNGIDSETSERTKNLKMALKTVKNEFTADRVDGIMAYVCKIHSGKKEINLNKCFEMGTTDGPLLTVLKDGKTDTLSNGNSSEKAEELSSSEVGPIIIVIEIPSEEYLDVLESHNDFKKYQSKGALSEDCLADYIIHFTPPEILANSRYQKWMNEFSLNTQHLIINEGNESVNSIQAHKLQNYLHLIHPTIFPLLAEMNTRDENIDCKSKIINCRILDSVILKPHIGFKPSSTTKIDPKSYIDEAFEVPGFLDALAELQTDINAKTKELGEIEEYPKILMLGSGSSVPTVTRNVSGILLQIEENKSMLLDCGENTFSQLIKFFGHKVNDVLKSIKAIFVSHLHADHHLGLIEILQQRQKVSSDPVFLLAPEQVRSWLREYNLRFETISSCYRVILNRNLMLNKAVINSDAAKALYDNLNIMNISTGLMKHCMFAYAVSVTLKNGKKIVYSGDTMPNENLIALSKNCDLLIHEATVEEGLESTAKFRLHSTVSQAINTGVLSKAEFTLLTHFSSRYKTLPILPESTNVDLSKVGITYDFMHFSLAELPLLPLFYPCLKVLFTNDMKKSKQKAELRQLKNELLLRKKAMPIVNS